MLDGMLELAWAFLLILALGAVTATVLVPWQGLLETGQVVMVASAAIGIPLEIIYYAALGFLLGRGRTRPAGWHWRSFAYHKELSPRARLIVLPFFFAGALAFLFAALGIGLVFIAFVAAARQL